MPVRQPPTEELYPSPGLIVVWWGLVPQSERQANLSQHFELAAESTDGRWSILHADPSMIQLLLSDLLATDVVWVEPVLRKLGNPFAYIYTDRFTVTLDADQQLDVANVTNIFKGIDDLSIEGFPGEDRRTHIRIEPTKGLSPKLISAQLRRLKGAADAQPKLHAIPMEELRSPSFNSPALSAIATSMRSRARNLRRVASGLLVVICGTVIGGVVTAFVFVKPSATPEQLSKYEDDVVELKGIYAEVMDKMDSNQSIGRILNSVANVPDELENRFKQNLAIIQTGLSTIDKNGAFPELTPQQVANDWDARNVVVGDVDADGDLEIVSTSYQYNYDDSTERAKVRILNDARRVRTASNGTQGSVELADADFRLEEYRLPLTYKNIDLVQPVLGYDGGVYIQSSTKINDTGISTSLDQLKFDDSKALTLSLATGPVSFPQASSRSSLRWLPVPPGGAPISVVNSRAINANSQILQMDVVLVTPGADTVEHRYRLDMPISETSRSTVSYYYPIAAFKQSEATWIIAKGNATCEDPNVNIVNIPSAAAFLTWAGVNDAPYLLYSVGGANGFEIMAVQLSNPNTPHLHVATFATFMKLQALTATVPLSKFFAVPENDSSFEREVQASFYELQDTDKGVVLAPMDAPSPIKLDTVVQSNIYAAKMNADDLIDIVAVQMVPPVFEVEQAIQHVNNAYDRAKESAIGDIQTLLKKELYTPANLERLPLLLDEIDNPNFDPDKAKAEIQTQLSNAVTRIGILATFLFLVQILVTTYRYMIRLSYFIEARADALDIAQGEDHGHISDLIAALSPDTLDFGKSPKTPVDKIIEAASQLNSEGIKRGTKQ